MLGGSSRFSEPVVIIGEMSNTVTYRKTGIVFVLILFALFSSTSPKTRMLLANSLESSAWFLYETVDSKNKDKWYVENKFISFIKIKFNKLSKGYNPSY